MSNGTATDTVTPDRVQRAAAAYGAASPLLTLAARKIMQRDSERATYALLILPTIVTDDTAQDGALDDLADDYARRALALARRAEHGEVMRTAAEIPCGMARDLDASGTYRPGTLAEWRDADTLAALADLSDDAPIIDALRREGSWKAASGTPNASAVARALGLTTSADVKITSERIAATLADAVRNARTVAEWRHADTSSSCEGMAHANAPDTRTSGTASAVVTTRANGERWVILPSVAHRIDDDTARAVLARTGTLAPYDTSESDAASDRYATGPVAADGLTRSGKRHQGVSVGIVYGAGSIAADMAPIPKPAVSRKRKRDGAIGASMIPA